MMFKTTETKYKTQDMSVVKDQVVQVEPKSADLRRSTMLIVKELQDKFIDVKKVVLFHLPEHNTAAGRARVGRVLSGITADSKIFAVLERIKADSDSK